jgi:hydrogenase/urease accessory protein HupE
VRAAIAFFVLVAALLVGGRASAHAIGLSRGEYVANGAKVTATLVLARGEAAALVSGLDANIDGQITDAEVQAARTSIETKLLGGVAVSGDGARCRATLDRAALTDEDGLEASGTFVCTSAAIVTIDLALLADLAHGHRHVARLTSGADVIEDVLFRGHDHLEVGHAAAPTRPPSPRFFDFLRMGVEHILTGYDHLLFLFALVIVGGRARSLVGVVTAFTAAHSITLALAALDVWSPSSRVVEPAIALSIAYVGVENFFVKNAEKRWRITFPFGLVHGFGFASALREIELPRARIPAALVSFNLGVELGQLAVLAVVLPLVVWLRQKEWFASRGARGLSAAVVAAGLFWFVQRAMWPA